MSKRKRSEGKPSGPRKVRVDFRPNRQDRRRRKAIPGHLSRDADADGTVIDPISESVTPKGELSRKRTVCHADAPTPDGLDGVVTAVRGLTADVDGPDGRRYACTVRRVLRTLRIEERHPVTVGDRVRFAVSRVTGDTPAEGVIVAVTPRRTQLRRANQRRTHVIAANVDQVVVVASIDMPPLKPSLIDRYLVSASAGMMGAVVCVNKTDLDRRGAAAEIVERYRRIGYSAVATSAVTGEGIDALRRVIAGKSSVFAGQSGVGKSSLLNALQPGLALRIGEVCDTTEKGRHTTTTAMLLKLDTGGYVVDTPGVRAFELANIPVSEIEAHFVEFEKHVSACKFPNCTHIHEAGCAIRAAVERGDIHPDRHASYVRLFRERCGLVPMEDYDEIPRRR